MKKYFIATALGAIIGAAVPATAGDLVEFDGGIGVIPAAVNNGAFAINNVLDVPPGGRPWAIKTLHAKVHDTGRIMVKGEGLVFAGGNVVGTAGTISHVAATLFCDGNALQSPAVPLQRNGDFRIDGMLAGTPPSPCVNPVLLIRNATAGTPGAWFAAGIPK